MTDDGAERLGYGYRLDEIAQNYNYYLIVDRRPTFAQIIRRTVLAAAIVVMVVMIIRLLTLQVQLTNHRESISGMQKSLEQITEDNMFEYRRLSDIEDLDSIRDIAMNDLGMVYPKSGQIMSFSAEESDYVRQTAPISGSQTESGVLCSKEALIKQVEP
jgi:cell division protein FtsB